MKTHIISLIVCCWVFHAFTQNTPSLIDAQHAYEKGQYKKAIELYKQAASENRVLAYFNIGNAYYQLDSIYCAVSYYKSALLLAPDFFPANQNLSIAYYTLNELGKAIALLHRCLSLKPDDEQCTVMLGAAYRDIGEPAKAALEFEKALHHNNNRHDLKIAVAELYRELSDVHTALAWLDRYPETGENLLYVLNLKADIYESIKEYEKARYYLNKVFNADPQRRWILFRLAQLFKDDGSLYSALETAEQGVRLFPDFKEISLLAGNCAFELNDFPKAEHYYTIAKNNGAAGGIAGLHNVENAYLNRLTYLKGE